MTLGTELPWDGYVNVRDLGGMPTRQSASGITESGRIARGPRRELLSDAGWAAARAWGLHSVVDLRCMEEVGRRDADPVISEDAMAGLTIVNAPTEDHTNTEFKEVCFPILDSPEYWQHNWRILPEMVRATFEAIATAESGILIHCGAGRDRTGMICALLLGNAGVGPADVAADYAASVHAMAGTATHAPTHDRQASWSTETVNEWLKDKLPLVEETAGSARAILSSLKVSSATQELLRAKLVD